MFKLLNPLWMIENIFTLHWIGAAVSIGSALLGSSASSDAADTQAKSAKYAADQQLQMFNTINAQQKPYRDAGVAGLNKLSYLTGLGGTNGAGGTSVSGTPLTYAQWAAQQGGTTQSAPTPRTGHQSMGGYVIDTWNPPNSNSILNSASNATQAGYQSYLNGYNNSHQVTSTGGGLDDSDPNSLLHKFNAGDLNANLAPNYQFMLDQGKGALNNQNNATGGLVSGNALKGLNDYAQNYASNGYQQAYNNYTNNQTNIYNRLSGIAGLGQTANAATANAGQTAATNSGNFLTSGANATASGIVGSANAITAGANNALGWNYLSSMNGNNSGSSFDTHLGY